MAIHNIIDKVEKKSHSRKKIFWPAEEMIVMQKTHFTCISLKKDGKNRNLTISNKCGNKYIENPYNNSIPQPNCVNGKLLQSNVGGNGVIMVL